MVKHISKILQQILQGFHSVFDHFGTLCITELINWRSNVKIWCENQTSHKKRKDSLETQAKLVVLRTYVENQAILEPSYTRTHSFLLGIKI